MEREQHVVHDQLTRNGVVVADGTARFLDPHAVLVTNPHHEYALTADHVLIATGSTPARSPAIPVDGQRIFDTDALPHLHQLPRDLIVVGASVIGLEFASMITALHRRVTIIDQRPVVLEFADGEIVEALGYQLRRRGAAFRLGERVVAGAARRARPRRGATRERQDRARRRARLRRGPPGQHRAPQPGGRGPRRRRARPAAR